MSTIPDDGGQAFPGFTYTEGLGDARRSANDQSWETWSTGMTLRDYFAAAVMSPTLVQAYGATPEIFAQRVYGLADAMIAERAKPRKAKV